MKRLRGESEASARDFVIFRCLQALYAAAYGHVLGQSSVPRGLQTAQSVPFPEQYCYDNLIREALVCVDDTDRGGEVYKTRSQKAAMRCLCATLTQNLSAAETSEARSRAFHTALTEMLRPPLTSPAAAEVFRAYYTTYDFEACVRSVSDDQIKDTLSDFFVDDELTPERERWCRSFIAKLEFRSMVCAADERMRYVARYG